MSATSAEPLRLPESARLLHIGPPKTGSTALQAAMHSRREEMRRHGVVHVAGDQRGKEAVYAALMDPDFAEHSEPRVLRRWQRLLDEMGAAGEQRVCLSNESLGRIDEAGVRRMVGALGGDRAHVVAVARRLDRLLPSQWQEWVRVGTTSLSYEQWLEVVLGDNPADRHWRDFWLPHDLERLVDRWVDATAPDRFTLIIADETEPRLLSRSFEQLLGLPDGLLRAEETHRANKSASLVRVEVVRRLNLALDELPWPADVKAALRSRVAKRIRSAAPWPGESPIPPLPSWAAAHVTELNLQREKWARSLGVRVIGDPANLGTPVPDAATEPSMDLVSTELAVQSVLSAIGGAVELLQHQQDHHQRVLNRLRRRAREQDSAPRGPELQQVAARDLAAELRRRAAQRLRNRN